MRLEVLVDSVREHHTQRIVPVADRILLPPQTDLFSEPPRNEDDMQCELGIQTDTNGYAQHANASTLGYFYELMTAAFYGGMLYNNLYLAKDSNCGSSINGAFGNNENLVRLVKPDIIDKTSRRFVESKAAVSGRAKRLVDEQIEGYKLLQKHFQDYNIVFCFYRHRITNIHHFPGTDDDLFKAMVDATYHSVSLPFSIVLQLHERNEKLKQLVYRDDRGVVSPGTAIKSPTLNRFLTEPEKVIEEIGLKCDDYLIGRLLSPAGFGIGDNCMNPFPIVKITDVDHSSWIEQFIISEERRREGTNKPTTDESYTLTPEEEARAIEEFVPDPALPGKGDDPF